MGVPLGLLFLEIDGDLSEISLEERTLLLRLKDVIFEIQQTRPRNEAIDGDGH